jgi:hypothetical protein
MSDISFGLVEESSSSTSHTYRAHLKQDGNRSHLSGDFHTRLKNISHEEYRKKKYTIGSASDMVKEDFEEILRFFDKRSSQEIYEDCIHLLNDTEDLDTVLPECRTNYHFTTIQRDYLMRFWLFHMGVEDHVASAILLKGTAPTTDEGRVASLSQCTLQNLTTIDAGGVVGLSRMDRFHRLLDEGVLGDRVGRHYIPQTKHGSVYWSENFTFAYNTVYTEPLRPVATTALSRLLTERLHLLHLPRPQSSKGVSSSGRGSGSGSGSRGGGGGARSGAAVLEGVLGLVELAPPVPVSATRTAVETTSPHYRPAPLPLSLPFPVSAPAPVECVPGEGGEEGGSVSASPVEDRSRAERSSVEFTPVHCNVSQDVIHEGSSESNTNCDSDSDSSSGSDSDDSARGSSLKTNLTEADGHNATKKNNDTNNNGANLDTLNNTDQTEAHASSVGGSVSGSGGGGKRKRSEEEGTAGGDGRGGGSAEWERGGVDDRSDSHLHSSAKVLNVYVGVVCVLLYCHVLCVLLYCRVLCVVM